MQGRARSGQAGGDSAAKDEEKSVLDDLFGAQVMAVLDRDDEERACEGGGGEAAVALAVDEEREDERAGEACG